MDNVFYHVNKWLEIPMSDFPSYSRMEEGDTINYRGEDNHFIRHLRTLEGFEFLDDAGHPDIHPMEKILNELNSEEYKNNREFPDSIRRILGHYQDLTQELTLELIRIKNFKTKPSRFKCLWLAVTYKSAKEWKIKCAGGYKSQILKVQAEGNIHRCEASHLDFKSKPLNELMEKACLYWKGVEIGPLRQEEILFEGEAKVIEVLPNDQ
ncbi:MAG: DUF2441 domain-containing protein [Nitrospinae bacterium]|nr:DUF2441 domain-containing protein [Nitrospinota bacterium]